MRTLRVVIHFDEIGKKERKHLSKLINSWVLLNRLELFSTECTLPNEFDLCVHNALVLPWMTVQSSTKVEYWS
jgi:hypothetical protein